jgi:transcriptional regulator with XRE-family HTH domain
MITTNPDQVGVVFKAMRQKRELTLRQVSEQTGVSQSFIWKVERGKVLPSLDVVIRLAKFYGFSLELQLIEQGVMK